jgi:hypothetical protein
MTNFTSFFTVALILIIQGSIHAREHNSATLDADPKMEDSLEDEFSLQNFCTAIHSPKNQKYSVQVYVDFGSYSAFERPWERSSRVVTQYSITLAGEQEPAFVFVGDLDSEWQSDLLAGRLCIREIQELARLFAAQ